MFKILVVEDDEKLRKLFCTILSKNNYETFSACDGGQALSILDNEYMDLIISDIMMPNINGYELTKSLRKANFNIPILFVSVKEDFNYKQRGFLVGIDDYMVKPIDVNEMVLRVSALLRRSKISVGKKIEYPDIVLKFDSFTVEYNGKKELLPRKEFYLLYKLLSYPDKIFTRNQLMNEFWGFDTETDERTVDVHINRIRNKFEECRSFKIITVRGLGYKAVKNFE